MRTKWLVQTALNSDVREPWFGKRTMLEKKSRGVKDLL